MRSLTLRAALAVLAALVVAACSDDSPTSPTVAPEQTVADAGEGGVRESAAKPTKERQLAFTGGVNGIVTAEAKRDNNQLLEVRNGIETTLTLNLSNSALNCSEQGDPGRAGGKLTFNNMRDLLAARGASDRR